MLLNVVQCSHSRTSKQLNIINKDHILSNFMIKAQNGQSKNVTVILPHIQKQLKPPLSLFVYYFAWFWFGWFWCWALTVSNPYLVWGTLQKINIEVKFHIIHIFFWNSMILKNQNNEAYLTARYDTKALINIINWVCCQKCLIIWIIFLTYFDTRTIWLCINQ